MFNLLMHCAYALRASSDYYNTSDLLLLQTLCPRVLSSLAYSYQSSRLIYLRIVEGSSIDHA